jgi:hypothetical protein
VEAAVAALLSAHAPQLTLGSEYAVRAPEEQSQLRNIGRIQDGVCGAHLDGSQQKGAIFAVTKDQDRRMTGLRADLLELAQAGLFRLQVATPQVEEDHVGPRKNALELVYSFCPIRAENKPVSQSSRNRFA